MDENLKNSFDNILLSAGTVIEYLLTLQSKNLVVPNNKLNENSSSKYNGLISNLNNNINTYNTVLDEFVLELNDTEKLLNNLKISWLLQDENKLKLKQSPKASTEEVPPPQAMDLKIEMDDDTYLNQFLENDVIDNNLDTNGLLDFNDEISNSQTNEIFNDEVDKIDTTKNPADILGQTAVVPEKSINEVQGLQDADINLDDLEELLASTNDADVNYDQGQNLDDDNIFDELNYFLGDGM